MKHLTVLLFSAPLLLMGSACPGKMGRIPDRGAGGWDSLVTAQDGLITAQGDGQEASVPEGGPIADSPGLEGGAPDQTLVPDQMVPDQTVPLDKGLTTGGPCPCASPLVCVESKCRSTCTAPTDPCYSVSNCPATEACVPTNTSLFVCMPGVGPGKTCSITVFCYNKHVCGSVGSTAYQCLPVCSVKGASCGATGGTCLQASSGGCMFCSKP